MLLLVVLCVALGGGAVVALLSNSPLRGAGAAVFLAGLCMWAIGGLPLALTGTLCGIGVVGMLTDVMMPAASA